MTVVLSEPRVILFRCLALKRSCSFVDNWSESDLNLGKNNTETFPNKIVK